MAIIKGKDMHHFKFSLIIMTLLIISSNISTEQINDCRRIVFTAFSGSEDSEIYTMNVDGLNITRLTDNDSFESEPRWSPDGNSIVFISSRDNSQSIFTMDNNGNDITRLSDVNASDLNPAWSPDGSQIAFGRQIGLGSTIFVMDSDGANVNQVTSSNGNWRDALPEWSPDGSQIAFVSNRDDYDDNPEIYSLYVQSLDTFEEKQIVVLEESPRRLNWLSDEETMILDMDTLGRTIFELNLVTESLNTLSGDSYLENSDYAPAVSHDETIIIFVHNGDIYRMDRDGSNRTNLMNTPRIREFYPDIQPIDVPCT